MIIKQILHATIKLLDEILTETKTWKEWVIIITLLSTMTGIGLLSVLTYVVVMDRNRIYDLFESTPRLADRLENPELVEILETNLQSRGDIENLSVVVYYFERRSINVALQLGVQYNVRDRLIIDDSHIHGAHLSNSCITAESLISEGTYRTSCPIISPVYGLEGYLLAAYTQQDTPPTPAEILQVEIFLREMVFIVS